MKDFLRILKALILVIGLPAACGYQVFNSYNHPSSMDNIGWYIIGVILWVVIIIVWYIKNQENH